VKTLDKTKILNKKWYIKDETGWTHYFYPDGKYHDNGGTWKWLGDEKSDSMEVYQYAGSIRFVLYFEYCTDTELSTKWGKSDPAFTLYKDREW